VPSQTELIADLGGINRLVGRTRFCVHPDPEIFTVPVIGGTKSLHMDKIRELSPDLIIANKEENEKDQIELLAEEFPVWVSDVSTLEDALEMVFLLGEILDSKEDAKELIRQIQGNFVSLKKKNNISCIYLIWKSPWMCAGSGTFISDMLARAGYHNLIHEPRYPELIQDKIKNLNPEVVLLSSEPFPFTEKHIAEVESLFPASTVKLVNGEYFSWYGSRMLGAPKYFQSL
jgi:ABC-type Fe3+-hydroxamate transport system substrate-binding protein